ncbi:aminopeptidase [Oceanirhabdus seepicola]|uniref:Aminopeptidase n=1 Tax=Oceanirhabdus seepicola TaxID=2828781 RepID=A0A9J6NZF2_9CLOT|nr:aminopeptidase [Oceanirhabdus seepicola]MCM1989358.1 aminopeptidase [Oceanirhabdus seepicola]
MAINREFYGEKNLKAIEGLENQLIKLRVVVQTSEEFLTQEKNSEGFQYGINEYFSTVGQFLIKLIEKQETLNDDHFTKLSFEELKRENLELYSDINSENYEKSFANPRYAVNKLGKDAGQPLSYIYINIIECVPYIFRGRVIDLASLAGLFIEIYEAVACRKDDIEKNIRIMVCEFISSEEEIFKGDYLYWKEALNHEFTQYTDLFKNDDLNDLRYLFKYGKYISEDEMKIAEFLNKYPKEKINKLAKSIVDAYLRGFIVENKDRGDRDSVPVLYSIGQEVILRAMIEELNKVGLSFTIQRVLSSDINKQYSYDHKFDRGLFFTKEYGELFIQKYKEGFELNKKYFDRATGPIIIEAFGEKPFNPEKKEQSIKISSEQEGYINIMESKTNQIIDEFYPDENTSFCIIAFPTPEIGERFEEIFEDTLEMNMMENEKYEIIQQHIIDVLDKGDYIHIKGKDGNETDIKVKLPKLNDSDKETNFFNCVADVNIPLGEVFTTPQLKGTEGVLHLRETFLDLKYENLKLQFKDGYVDSYGCTNFDDEEKNKQYVKENLLELHDKLPLGEFAIGTNTVAYMMAKKYDIIDVLPVLIIEKMGPHFAIGDTCYSRAEDLKVYNLINKKEIVAKDNEHSIKRKENVDEAYTNVHTDITLPYEEIDFISVVTFDGEKIDIIRDGKFVVEGTEELNEVFEA